MTLKSPAIVRKEFSMLMVGGLLWSKYKAENSNIADIEEDNHLFEDDEGIQEDVFHYDKSELIERIETLIPLLLELKSDFSGTLISNLFSIVLKSEKKKPTPNWKLVNDFCNHFNPDTLSNECSTGYFGVTMPPISEYLCHINKTIVQG